MQNKNKLSSPVSNKSLNLDLIDIDQQLFWGSQHVYFSLLEKLNPKLKLGIGKQALVIKGKNSAVENFAIRFDALKKLFKIQGDMHPSLIQEAFGKDTFDDKDFFIYKKAIQHPFFTMKDAQNKKILVQSDAQNFFIDKAQNSDVIFSLGTAGTGKTFIAIAYAVQQLKNQAIGKIYLSRPVVEAGEHLGFLPGDLKEKIDPYLRPLYDILAELLPDKVFKAYGSQQNIEIAPLAYMRGRTLKDCIIILDEAQNANLPQLKMLLTRMGKNSQCFINGDVSQIDLPKPQQSGLLKTVNLLCSIDGIEKIIFHNQQIMRHPIVKKIVNAFDTL